MVFFRRAAVSLVGLAACALPATAGADSGKVIEPAARVPVLPASEAPPPPGARADAQMFEVPLRTPGPAGSAGAEAAATRELREPGGAFSPTPNAAVFGGLNAAGLVEATSTPPDTTGAIGPSHYVEMINREVAVYSKTDLSIVGSSMDIDDFVGAPGTNVFDVQVKWDPTANRWLYAADRRDAAEGDNFIAFGWSKTTDPSDLATGWCRFFIDTDDEFDDYPKLGHNDNHIIIGANVFEDSVGGPGNFLTARIWAVAKPALGDTTCTAPAPATSFGSAASPLLTADGDTVFTPMPANTADSSANGYVVAADFFTGDAQIMAWHISGPAATPTLTADGNIAVTAFGAAPPAPVPQPGTDNVLDSLDTRLTQAVAHDDPGAGGADAVWTQHTIAGAGGRSVVRWYELLPATDAVRQEGTISDPTHFVFNGAISPALNGTDAAINYNVGSATLLPEIRAQSRDGSTALGTMAIEVVLDTSSTFMNDFSCVEPDDLCRWGDYAAASPDPTNTTVVWGSNQAVGPAIGGGGPPAHWTTQNFALIHDPGTPPTAVDDADTVAEDSGPNPIDVLANDTDPDGGPKAIAAKTNGTNGTVTITNGGADLTYAPNANYCGPDSFTYTLNGGSVGTVSVTVTCLDDGPVAVGDSSTVAEDSAATTIDVLANDTDVDGGTKTIVSKTDGANGTVVITNGGADLTYAPSPNFCGATSFTYTLNGGSVGTVSVTVTCIEDPAVAVDDSATVNEDSGANTITVRANDTDTDPTKDLITAKTNGANGLVTLTNGGADLTYAPNANFCGPDSFTYTLSGGDTATVSVAVTCLDEIVLDLFPPETTITKEPKNKLETSKDEVKAKYKFTSNEPGSTFECKFDKESFEPCTSPEKLVADLGKHKFQVKATDAAGNTDSSPDKDGFKVKEK